MTPPFRLDGSLGSVWAVERFLADHVRGRDAECPWLESYIGALVTRAWQEMRLPVESTPEGGLSTAGYRIHLRRDCAWLISPPDPLPTFCGRTWPAHPQIGLAAVPWYVLANIVRAHTWADGGVELGPAHGGTVLATPWLVTQAAWAIGGHDARLYQAAYHAWWPLAWPLDGWGDLEATARPLVHALGKLDHALATELLRRAVALQDQWLATLAARAMIDTNVAVQTELEHRAREQALAWTITRVDVASNHRAASTVDPPSAPVVGARGDVHRERVAELAAPSVPPSSPREPSYEMPFGTVTLGERVDLLLDRVRLSLPRDAVVEPHVRHVDALFISQVLRTSHSATLSRGPRRFVATAFDELVSVGDNLQRAAEHLVRRYQGPWCVLPAAHERVRVALPDRPEWGVDGSLLAIALVAQTDGSLSTIELSIDETSTREAPEVCRALAAAVAHSVEPGERRLLVGPLALVTSHGTIPLPEHFTVRVDRGADYTIVRLTELAPVGRAECSLDLHFGPRPSFYFERADPPIRPHAFDVEVLGAPTQVHVYELRKRQAFELMARVDDPSAMHARGSAPDVKANLDLIHLVKQIDPQRRDPAAEGHVDLEHEVAYWFALATRRDVAQELHGLEPGGDESRDAQQRRGRLDAVLPELEALAFEQRARIARERGEAHLDRYTAERVLCGALIAGVPEAEAWLDAPDAAIASLDARIGAQLDAILHHPNLMAMEAAWRGAWWMATLAMGQRIQIEIVSVQKRELWEDLQDSPEVAKSGLYRQLYRRVFEIGRSRPLGLVLLGLDIDGSKRDLHMLRDCAEVARVAHAPLVAAANGLFAETPLHALDDASATTLRVDEGAWASLRERGTHTMLVCGRVLLRMPYRGESYTESVSSPSDLVWGHPGLVVAARLAAAFDASGWGLPIQGTTAPPGLERVSPLEVVLSDERRADLAELGVATLRGVDDEDAVMLAELPMLAPAGDGRPGAGLPHLLVATRIAQAIKMMLRGAPRDSECATLERAIRDWLAWYVLGEQTAGRFRAGWLPFAGADVTVTATAHHHWLFHLTLTPNWAERGGAFTITATGKLDQLDG